MVAEDEVGVEYLDPAVACVHHVDLVLSVHGEAAGLDKSLLSWGNAMQCNGSQVKREADLSRGDQRREWESCAGSR